MTRASQKFDIVNYNITTSSHMIVHDYVHLYNVHHYINVLSNMEGHINMSSSTLRVRVRGLPSVHFGVHSVFSSTLHARSHIAIALVHSSSLAVISSRGVHKKWNYVVSIGGSLGDVVYVRGRHSFSALWNAVLPHWGHTRDNSYVLLLFARKSTHTPGSHSLSTKACHVA